VLAAIFIRLPNAADVVRCVATCRRWASVVAKEADALSRALRLPPLPALALGFFHRNQDRRQDAGGAETTNTRKRKRRHGSTVDECSTPPCFVPTASGSRLLGFNLNLPSGTTEGLQHHGVDALDLSRPIASRNGRLVLELHSVDGSLRLCVCNPMMGDDVAVLPPLLGKDRPKVYACTLLTGADLDRPSSADLFRVLIVYNRDRFTALRSYSSDTCSWSKEAMKTSGPKLTNWELGKLGQGIVLHGGVAYWPLKSSALAVRFDTPAPPSLVRMPPDGVPNKIKQLRLLSVGPDGKLWFLDAASNGEGCVSVLWTVFHETSTGTGTGEWVRGGAVRLTRLKVKGAMDINLRWFCEKSGILLFTLGRGSSDPGTFAMNLATKQVDKLDDCSSWRNFVGYEMDGVTYLRSIAHISL